MRGRRGFTLLEVLVATVLMAIAITGLLTGLRTSLSNAARLTENDRAVALARRQMDALMVQRHLPKNAMLGGEFTPQESGGVAAGWQAQVTVFESLAVPGSALPGGTRMLERIQVEIWWMNGKQRRTFQLVGYRSTRIEAADMASAAPAETGAARGSE